MSFSLLKAAKTARSLIRGGELTKATDVVLRALGGAPAQRRDAPLAPAARTARTPDRRAGDFVDGRLATASQARYKLYIPPGAPAQAPLVVMLHGCTQDPDDFASGTAMNARAEAQGFYVLYPEQPSSANMSRCWNWYRPGDQRRDAGEPALIAEMTRAVIAAHDLDPSRVHVAGLSAGGAMAAIVASQYPELFASVGVHSGLPIGSAANVPDAFSVMRTGRSHKSSRAHAAMRFVPTIVFQGDRDTTVHPANGLQVVEQALSARHDLPDATKDATKGVSSGGKRYTQTTYRSKSDAVLAEHWMLHDVAHAWSGGDLQGTHTDAKGPSATDEMLRFFRAHPRT